MNIFIEAKKKILTPANRKKIRFGVSFSALFVALVALWDHLAPLRMLEEHSLDLRYQYFNRDHEKPDDVFVIDIDEQSVGLLKPAYGSWPWPRKIYKDIIEFTTLAEASGLYFDLMMYEPQLNTDNDQILAEAIAAHGKTSFAMKFEEISGLELNEGERRKLPEGFAEKYFIPELEGLKNFPQPIFYRDFGIPAQAYLDRIPLLHSVNSPLDSDGVYRRVPLLMKYENGWLPTLSLRAVFGKLTPEKPYPDDLHYDGQYLVFNSAENKRIQIPVDSSGMMRLHFYNLKNDNGREPLAPIMESARRLQSGEVDDPTQLPVNPLAYAQKIFMIGSSAATLGDLKTTPLSPSYPGVLLHATAVSNILRADHLKRIPYFVRVLIGLFVIFLTLFFILLVTHPLFRFGIPIGFYVALVLVALIQFKYGQQWWDLAMPSVVFFGSFLLSLLYMIFVEGQEKKKIQDTLGKYLPPSVISEMIANGTDLRAEVGKKMELSILFSDIRGFTSLSEVMPPEKVVSILNAYLGRMTDVVFENRGTLDKFIGDAIMSFWGAPVTDADHAYHSVRCGLRMIDALKALKAEWRAAQFDTGVDLQIGIGINTGVVIVGNIGSERKLDYTVIGDNVNLASRLEGLTKQYKSQLIIGSRTQELLGDKIILRTADKVKVMGKANAVKIFEPLCEKGDPREATFSKLSESFEKAWSLYEKGDFKTAHNMFQKIDEDQSGSDGLTQVYLDRCHYFMDNPPSPSSWDGIFVAKSK
jgi:adenylate cyclase